LEVHFPVTLLVDSKKSRSRRRFFTSLNTLFYTGLINTPTTSITPFWGSHSLHPKYSQIGKFFSHKAAKIFDVSRHLIFHRLVVFWTPPTPFTEHTLTFYWSRVSCAGGGGGMGYDSIYTNTIKKNLTSLVACAITARL